MRDARKFFVTSGNLVNCAGSVESCVMNLRAWSESEYKICSLDNCVPAQVNRRCVAKQDARPRLPVDGCRDATSVAASVICFAFLSNDYKDDSIRRTVSLLWGFLRAH